MILLSFSRFYYYFLDCWTKPRLLQEAEDWAGDADGERDLSEQEAGDVRGERDAEADGGDAVQPAGQHLEILHCNI